jgi:hypothetical protein
MRACGRLSRPLRLMKRTRHSGEQFVKNLHEEVLEIITRVFHGFDGLCDNLWIIYCFVI